MKSKVITSFHRLIDLKCNNLVTMDAKKQARQNGPQFETHFDGFFFGLLPLSVIPPLPGPASGRLSDPGHR